MRIQGWCPLRAVAFAVLPLTIMAGAGAGASGQGVAAPDPLRSFPPGFAGSAAQGPGTAQYVANGRSWRVGLRADGFDAEPLTGRPTPVRMRLREANTGTLLKGQGDAGALNHFYGSGERQVWQSKPLFREVVGAGLYPGIGIRYYFDAAGDLEYDFRVERGADASRIRMHFAGASRLVIRDGAAEIHLAGGVIRLSRPRAYQQSTRGSREVKIAYRVQDGSIGFRVGEYCHAEPLIIDPSVNFASYFGGSSYDAARAVAVDLNGNWYLAGDTMSSPGPGGGWVAPAGSNVFVAKLGSDGKSVAWVTYLGGRLNDSGRAIAVDPAGNAYLAGTTNSPDFPTTSGAYQRTLPGRQSAFVVKLNASGGIVYSTLLGGADTDFATGISINSAGNAYVCGYTSSINFPTTSAALQRIFGGGYFDGFIAELYASGGGLVFSTLFGGSGIENINGVAVDATGYVYVAGLTDSYNLPVKSAAQGYNAGGQDAFVAAFSPSGSGLLFASYLGGLGADVGTAVAVDPAGNVYVAGHTSSWNFPSWPTSGIAGDYDGFVARYAPAGTLVYSILIGGSGFDQVTSLRVDSSQRAWAAGATRSGNLPLANPVQSALAGASDAFLATVSSTGGLTFSTYFGGAGEDHVHALAVDSQGSALIAGTTTSAGLGTSGVVQSASAGGTDALLAKISVGGAVLLRPSRVGAYRDGAWMIDTTGSGQPASARRVTFGQVGDIPVIGDWTGDGTTKIGVFRDGTWRLADAAGNLATTFVFGQAGDIPVVGDWTGNGRTKAGVFRKGIWLLADESGRLTSRGPIGFGQDGDVPIVGDWWGNGRAKIGCYRNGIWFLADDTGGLSMRGIIVFGAPGDLPVWGDWDGGGRTKIGVFRGGLWFLGDANGLLTGANIFWMGQSGDVPIAGDWNGDGRAKAGLYRNGTWIIDRNGNRATSSDEMFVFGTSGDKPLAGRW